MELELEEVKLQKIHITVTPQEFYSIFLAISDRRLKEEDFTKDRIHCCIKGGEMVEYNRRDTMNIENQLNDFYSLYYEKFPKVNER